METRDVEIEFVSAAEMGDRLGVRSGTVRRWARLGLVPKLVLPNGRFVFDPRAVVAALQERAEADHD